MTLPKLIVFDLDGTLYRGDDPCPDALDAVQALQNKAVAVRFMTNNSSKSPEAVADHLQRLGFRAAPDQVMTSALATAQYLASTDVQTAYVVGEDGLRDALTGHGITLTDTDPDAVVVGICRTFHYDQMNHAARLIRNGATFIASNEDATYPLADGNLSPGAGSIVAAIRTASGKDPVVIGKPHPTMLVALMAQAEVSPAETLVVGDRLDTDIECGRRAGCPTWLVLTGVQQDAVAGQNGSPTLRGLIDALDSGDY